MMRSLPLFAVLAGRAAGDRPAALRRATGIDATEAIWGADRPAALRRATGIDATEAIWGAPFRELAALHGGAPPVAALGVSAKFCPGRDHTARYHVALEPQPPRDGGPPLRRVPRAAQRKAAERTAAALKAPPLVHDWLEAILAASPPIFGFGVDRDAAAAKLYVQARPGAPLPPLPATQAMPPVVAQGSRTLALEWRVGSDTTALRQYAVQAGAAGAPRPDRDRLRAVAGARLAGALEAARDATDAAVEDVAACVEIKILRRVRAESSRRPPRHRWDACSMAWRCRFLAARRSQHGRVIAEK